MQAVTDNGPAPTVVNIEQATVDNTNYRTTMWTGNSLQLTLMSVEPGHDIGLEVHPAVDQFLRVEQGVAKVEMGPSQDQLAPQEASDGFAVFVPAGTWHNLTCVSDVPLKVYSIYSPVQHPHGTVHVTQADGEAAEAAENS
ncbi:cupin domain-containing protein [Candidatus Saccharibacteria bacterium]|nr:cupin domain-containing protein [Candidatus Saccharibacteria bacterium]